MSTPVTFDDYLSSLGRLTPHIDPTSTTAQTEAIKGAAQSLECIQEISVEALADWVIRYPADVPVLGLMVGLSQEKLKNALRNRFDTSGWTTLAKAEPEALITWFDEEFDLVRLTAAQLNHSYTLGDILVARAGTRVTATRAGVSGRRVEDRIEAVAIELGLPYATRTRFTGRNNRSAPCDLVIPGTADPQIVVAAKGFDSTGSKLTDAVREIEEMAEVRLPRQYVMAVIDGIGWKSRQSDLRKIHQLWTDRQIDGMYTLKSLDTFRDDLRSAALRTGLLPKV
ncbi:hypothetical protein NQ038_11695 [Brevibacterium sp. 50QC2O2]|uniref:hypothetical protein n=1 Tax=Brevibacterium TaxID=1696 RepID=UPI00211BD058|nr:MULTISPECIES: hypothetical protein [unclassified Brevibacterium]MCQ9369483.1 hypothetical protein [Brevibacterium sp. 91QC2O2]MCQ9386552.1 hypothetical protein [Brevibacterium sp. 68QC2CO]MCQ9389302.1 hypothetical protein [Brevibacterium sp. 50QC2O2]